MDRTVVASDGLTEAWTQRMVNAWPECVLCSKKVFQMSIGMSEFKMDGLGDGRMIAQMH